MLIIVLLFLNNHDTLTLLDSERLSSTEAVGDRLKEGVSINQSLACLGNCIHALAEAASGKNIRGNKKTCNCN